MAHRRPSQCRISVRAGPPGERDSPTAQAFEADRAATALRKLPPEGRSGLGTARQALPCQRSTSVLAGPPEGRVTPTAHTPPETTDTPSNSLDSRAPAGPVCTCHPPWQPIAGPASPVHDGSSSTRPAPPHAHRRLHPVTTEVP